jgi:hypothetical protein
VKPLVERRPKDAPAELARRRVVVVWTAGRVICRAAGSRGHNIAPIERRDRKSSVRDCT